MCKFLVVAVLILASFGLALLIDPFGEGPLEDLIEHSTVYSELETAGALGSPLHAISVGDSPPAEERRREYLARSQSTYKGVLSTGVVERLINAGRAEVLEGRLSPDASQRLQKEITPLRYALSEAARAASDEAIAVKKRLLHRRDRLIAIETWPPQRDPRYVEILRAREEIENKGLGAVWADAVNGREVHFIVRWKEWPILKSLRDEQYELIIRRRDTVQQWIEREFRKHGMSPFRGS